MKFTARSRLDTYASVSNTQTDEEMYGRDAAYAESGRLEVELADAIQQRDAALALLRRIYARDLIGWSDPLSREVYELLRRKP